ncbi:MAG TPA: energy transducer TonB [Gemmatimonadales bacterium]|nr:energy transducer TonB [Gemmatimonadales bacterium]
MLLTLIESKRATNKRKLFGVGFVSLTVHTALIVGAVYTTLHAARSDTKVRVDTAVVFLEPQQSPRPPEQQPMALAEPLKGFQTIVVPNEIPTDIPPVDLRERFDPTDYSGIGVEGGRANGVVPTEDQVYTDATVEERPLLLSAPPPAYPVLLRQAGIQGRVVVRAVVDTTGRVEPASVRILKSPSLLFNEPTKQWVLKALFRPARVHGRAAKVFVNLPVDYSFGS